MATSQFQTGTVVVSYFPDGEAAHRAINALIDEGFAPSEIGAAFHVTESGSLRTNSEAHRQPNIGGTLREELGTTVGEGSARSSTTLGAAATDTTAVQPGALGGGSGTPFGGAGRPGPISGSSLAATGLPTELKSTLPHDGDPGTGGAPSVGASHDYSASTLHTTPTTAHTHAHEGVLDRLKHVFGHHHTASTTKTSDTLTHEVTEDSKKFGTGEGDLHLNTPPRGLPYSQPAFEQSFSGLGVQSGHARHLSSQLGHGGAIVTVHAAARSLEAERILEASGGEVRFAGESSSAPATEDGLVEVFGTVHRDYPGYIK